MTVIQERSNTNVPTVHYTRGLDLSGTPGGAGGIGGLLTRSSGYNASTGAWSTHDYEHADGSGNITMLISNSSTPTIRAQYEYDPFGRIQTQTGTLATANTQRFSSKEQIGTSPSAITATASTTPRPIGGAMPPAGGYTPHFFWSATTRAGTTTLHTPGRSTTVSAEFWGEA